MTPPFSQFEDLKLVTEFIDRSCCKHTIAGEPVRYETWTRTRRLGGGSFGEVYKETCAETRNLRAVKQIRKSLAIRWNEVGILAQLRSDPEHFVQLIGWFEDKYDIYLAMEYLPGDLGGLLKERDLCEDDTKKVTKQILTGLETLHKKGICHRDLKPGNILIGKWAPLSVKIGDFGVSKHSDGSTEWRTTTGTTPFMAPEIQELSTSGEESSAYTTAVDIWSLGCLVYYMITKTVPFPETRNLIDFLRNQSPFPLRTAVARAVPDPAIEFIASLLQPLPANRAPASRALLHSWLLIEKRDETIWPDISSDASEPVSAPGTKQIGRIARDPTLAAKDKSAAVDKPGQKAQPRASTAPQRRVLQYLLVAAAASGNCDLLLQQLGKGARPMEDPSGYTPIYSAAKNGHLRIIKLLLEHGAHLGVEGTHGVSALHGAVRGRNLQIVQYLLDEGADISAREALPAGRTALQSAAHLGHLDIVRYLLDRGADISGKRLDNGFDALQLAAEKGHYEVVNFLLERGADISATTNGGRMAHHIAIQYGATKILELLVERGADISTREASTAGWTPLQSAALYGHLDIVRYLLDRGADISGKKLDNGFDALQLAAEKGHYEVVNFLLERGADISAMTNDGRMAHHIAAQYGATEVLKLLLDRGADISAQATSTGRTALLVSAFGGHLDTVRHLLDRGADISTREASTAGWTPLQFAAHFGYLDIVRYLLDRGADISGKKLDNGFDALQLAAEKGHYEVVNFLLERGADISATTNDGRMAHHIAADNAATKVLELLVERGADISAREASPAGWTALQSAAHFGHLDIVRYLLDRGADMSEKKLDTGYDALQLAAEKGHGDIVRLLLARGATMTSTTSNGQTAISLAALQGHTGIVIQLSEWLEKDMTIPFTEMDILKLSLQDSTQTTSEDGSTTLWDSRA